MKEQELRQQFIQAGTGDKSAFAAIYHDMKSPVYTVICRIVRSRETAEDVTQELFLKLYQSPPDSSVRNIRAWIFQIAHNLALNALKKKSSVELSEDMTDNDIPMDEAVCSRLDLDRDLQVLSIEEREIVALHLTADLSFKEIAGIVGTSLPAVYRKYRKALKSLQFTLNGGTE